MRLALALLMGSIALSVAKTTSSRASSNGNDTSDDDNDIDIDRGHPIDEFDRPSGHVITTAPPPPPPPLLQREHAPGNTTAASAVSQYPIGGTPDFVVPQLSDQPQHLYLSYFPIPARLGRNREIIRDDLADILYQASSGIRQLINTRGSVGSFDYNEFGPGSGVFFDRQTGLVLSFRPPRTRSRRVSQNSSGLTYVEALAVLHGLDSGYEAKGFRQEAKISVIERDSMNFDAFRGVVRVWYHSAATSREDSQGDRRLVTT